MECIGLLVRNLEQPLHAEEWSRARALRARDGRNFRCANAHYVTRAIFFTCATIARVISERTWSGIFRYIGFSKGSATQNHLYHNENVFRSIDMRRVSFAKNNFWDVWTSILIFWKYFCMNSRTKVHFWKIALKASLTKMIK